MSCDKNDDSTKDNTKEETISLGAEYVYDVYYSFTDGEVAKVVRSDWDLALSVPLQTATVLINEGSGVELYPAGAVSDWNSVDLSSVNVAERIWNNESDWLQGAFNRGAGVSSVFNYGWGSYQQTSHNVVADSVYIIKLTSGDYKKIKLFKNGAANTYVLTWANPDGTGLDSASVGVADASSKHFVHYSLVNKEVIEYEPAANSWDILFTVYTSRVSAQGMTMDYPVMGVLTNQNVEVAKASDVVPESASLADTTVGFSKANNTIGWDWKTNVPQTANYSIVENQSYFVKNTDGTIYQIYFTSFDGKSTGNVSFKTKLIE
jgi:hypothetical protein